MSQSFKLNLLLAFFVSCVITVNLAGAKTSTFFGINFSVGLLIFPFTFFILDAVSEVYGKAKSREFMMVSLICLSIILAYTFIIVQLEPSSRFREQDIAYKEVFGTSLRIMFASLTAFALAEFSDIFAFSWIKEKTKGKFLWLRSDISTYISQAVDTFLFMILAFYQITPQYTFLFVLQIAVPYYLLKIALATFGTPLVYLLVNWLKKDQKNLENQS